MSCGCGCCPKCGCSATCTCNNSLWSLESRSDFSYVGNPLKTAAEEYEEEQYNFNGDNEHSAEFSARAGAYRYAKNLGLSRGIIDNESFGGSYGCSALGSYNTDVE